MKRIPHAMLGRVVAVALGAALAGGPALAAEVSVRAPRLRLPLGEDAAYRLGLRLDARGEHSAAAQAYRAVARSSSPSAKRARFHLQLSEAVAKLRRQLVRAPDSYDDHFNYGVNLQNKYWALFLDVGVKYHRLFALAEHHFMRAVRLAPSAANPVLCLASLYAQAGDRGRAADVYARLMAGRIVRGSDHYNLAFFHKVMGDLDEAFRVLRQAFSFDARHRAWVLESDDFAEYLEDPRLRSILDATGAHEGALGQLRSRIIRPRKLIFRMRNPSLRLPPPLPLP
jgi:tetratricopeptide (TPR) repeat protein